MPAMFCPNCGYVPLIVRGDFRPGNAAGVQVTCPDCAWPFSVKDIERLIERYGPRR
jgi:rubredoxin